MTIQIYLIDEGKISWCNDYQLLAYNELQKKKEPILNYNNNGYTFKLLLDNHFNIAILVREDNSIGGYLGLYDNILNYLKNKLKLPINYSELLCDIEGLYIYKFLSDKNQKLVLSVVDDPIKLNYLVDHTFIVKPSKYTNADINNHLSNRIPIYYGKQMKKFYREDVFMKLLDGDTDKRLSILDSGESPIYTICGPMMTPGRETEFCAVHCWGLNFESKHTLDYMTYISGTQLQNGDKLKLRLKTTLESIFIASNRFHKERHHELRIPYIGLGCYLTGIDSWALKETIRKLFFILLKEITNKYKNISVVICNPDQSYNTEILKIEDDYENNNYFEFDNNLFKLSCIRTTWVNAWDTHSFIGNGGCYDNSIDGWFVSGNNVNTDIENASYLHNTLLFMEDRKIISY